MPDGRAARPSGQLLQRLRPAGRRDRRRVEARPVLQPDGTGQPLRDHRARDLGRHRRQGHPLRRGRRHRRHHHRRRPLPQGGVRRQGAHRRRRPRGIGVLRRHRSAVPGRGRRRGLLAVGVRPDRARRDHRGLRRRFVRDDAAAGPRGRRCWSAGRAAWPSSPRSRSPSRPDPTRWWWCCCRTADAVICQRSSTTRGCRPTDSCALGSTVGRGVDGRRRAARQVRGAARPGAHASVGDGARRDRDPARVRRVADAGRRRRTAGDGRRGRGQRVRARTARPRCSRAARSLPTPSPST